MRPSPESELEQAIDRELRELSELKAPETLVPRVLRAIAEREQLPWWSKSFAFWPAPARLLFLMLTSGLAVLLLYFTWGLSVGVTWESLAREVTELAARVDLARDVMTALGGAMVLLVRSAGSWLIWGGAVMVGASYLTAIGLGTVWHRMASQRI
jgi:hypothetical protein